MSRELIQDQDVLNNRWERIAFRQVLQCMDPRCLYCRRLVRSRGATIDHVVPLSRGGSHHVRNLVLACRHCNEAKANRTLPEWIDDLQRACDVLALALRNERGPHHGAV